MNRIFSTLVIIICSSGLPSYSQVNDLIYQYETNIEEVEDDKLHVKLTIGGLSEETLTYCFPKIVPGIYGAMNFGQYISSFQVYDKAGQLMEVQKTGENCWEITKANQIAFLSYLVDDAWEKFDDTMERGFYRSAASSFGDSVYVITPHSLFGYFRGYTDHAVEVKVRKKKWIYPATSLTKTMAEKEDVFFAEDYHQLVDNPILYAKPDTTSIELPGISVEVACYSTSGESISGAIAEYIRPLLQGQAKYLDNQLPVDKYTFIIYHNFRPGSTSILGDGLEHSNSTLILLFMPLDMEVIRQNVYGIASHEFFHTLMPLGLHSHEIENYDYNEPEFSKHIWLYEGMTEYFTIHMPVWTGLGSVQEFLDEVAGKAEAMKEFDPELSITSLSRNPMGNQDQYYNVYLKGALLNLCLDVYLREWSKGKYGVKDMVMQLMRKYGKGQPFEDDTFFEEIISVTGFDGVREFINKYIEGTEPLPLEDVLNKVGYTLNKGKIVEMDHPTPEQLKLRKSWLN